MKKILFINSVCDFGSTGKLVRYLSETNKYDTLICYGRKKARLNENTYKTSNGLEVIAAMANTFIFGNCINNCYFSTKKLIKKIEEYKPDLVHIHNIHGYYLNITMLMKYLSEKKIPIVYTFHDCWPFTGYCAYFDYCKCDKYKTRCQKCKHKFSYPYSIFKQKVKKEYYEKKLMFADKDRIHIVVPSKWLKLKVKESFLKEKKISVINNGINRIEVPRVKKFDKFTVLFVSNYWTVEKGRNEIKKIIKLLNKDIRVVIVGGLRSKKGFEKCEIVERTNNFEELVKLYTRSHIFANPTLEDNFPTVNIEALACGTPVVTYNTGGSPEMIDKKTGIIIEKYDYMHFAEVINSLYERYVFKVEDCIEKSKEYTSEKMKNCYYKLYNLYLEKNEKQR